MCQVNKCSHDEKSVGLSCLHVSVSTVQSRESFSGQYGKDGKGRRADIRSTPVDAVSSGLQVRTHRGHCKVTGRAGKSILGNDFV